MTLNPSSSFAKSPVVTEPALDDTAVASDGIQKTWVSILAQIDGALTYDSTNGWTWTFTNSTGHAFNSPPEDATITLTRTPLDGGDASTETSQVVSGDTVSISVADDNLETMSISMTTTWSDSSSTRTYTYDPTSHGVLVTVKNSEG